MKDKLDQAYISGRALAKVVGMESKHWLEIDHKAHLDCLLLGIEPLPCLELLEAITIECQEFFESGDGDDLMGGVTNAMKQEGVDDLLSGIYAAGVFDEATRIRSHIKSL